MPEGGLKIDSVARDYIEARIEKTFLRELPWYISSVHIWQGKLLTSQISVKMQLKISPGRNVLTVHEGVGSMTIYRNTGINLFLQKLR